MISIKHNNQEYRYDFNDLTIEQAELAREVGEFRYNVQQNMPDSFTKMVKSKAADWLIIAGSYLLNEVKNGEVVKYAGDTTNMKTEKFIRSLPVKELKTLTECVEDFFSLIGKDLIISTILHNKKNLNAHDLLLELMKVKSTSTPINT